MYIVVFCILMVITLCFVKLVWIRPIIKALTAHHDELLKSFETSYLIKKDFNDKFEHMTHKVDDIQILHGTLAKDLEKHKEETTKIFETATEGFEYINKERTLMINDLDELKKRVRMVGNETKRQTYKKRHNTNKRVV